MTKIRLTYFNLPGRAEVSRMILNIKGVQFEDVRIEFQDWPAKKNTFPFKQLPVLEVDGVMLTQSRAIAGYLAREYGLAGKSSIEAGLSAALVDSFNDMAEPIFVQLRSLPDPSQKEAKLKELQEGHLKNWLEMLEQYFKSHLSKEGYIVGHQLTYADLNAICIWDSLESPRIGFTALLDHFPTLAKHRKFVLDLPEVKKFHQK